MPKFLFSTLVASLLFAFSASAVDASPEFELIIVESLPEDITLNMSLSDILRAKENSRLQMNKRLVYDTLIKNLSPLLSSQSFIQDYNLLALAQEVPIQKIVDELMHETSQFDPTDEPADFMALVLPRLPFAFNEKASYPFAGLYSPAKAAVIDNGRSGFQPAIAFDDRINQRILDGIRYVYNNQYRVVNSNQAFFVGMMVHIHMAGPDSMIRVQMIGGLPTNQKFAFEQIEEEAHFTEIRTPSVPNLSLTPENYPGAILEISYRNGQAAPVQLKIAFGSLGMINGKDWIATDALPDFEDLTFGAKGFAITSVFKRFNVPHLYGDILTPVGMNSIDSMLARFCNIKMNIMEVVMDLRQLTITDMRVAVELPLKNIEWIPDQVKRFLPWMILEGSDINTKFVEAGNAALEPHRQKLQMVMNNDPATLITQPEVQSQLLAIFNQLLTKTTVGAQ